MTHDVLGDDHGIVDHEPGRDRHRTERHEVERLPEERHREHGDRHRERDRRGADRGDARVAQEDEQDEDGEQGADEHRVAHRAHRVADELGLIVHRAEPHARRQRGGESLHHDRHAVSDRDRVAADLPGDAELRDEVTVAADHADSILGAEGDGREVSHAEPGAYDHITDVLDRMRFVRRDDEVLPVVARQSPDGVGAGTATDRVREVGVREPLLREARWVGDDLDFVHVGALNVNAADTRYAREDRFDLVPRDVVERRRIATLEVVGEDREEGRREPVRDDVESRRELAEHLIDALLHELQRVLHLRSRGEGHVEFGRTADRARLYTDHAGHDAHRLLDRPRDAGGHLPRAERRALRDDRDAREGEFGIDRGRQTCRRPHAGGAHQRHREIDEPPLLGEAIEPTAGGRHGRGATTFAPSVSPYAPLVTTRSPAAMPPRTSASPPRRAPTVTSRA